MKELIGINKGRNNIVISKLYMLFFAYTLLSPFTLLAQDTVKVRVGIQHISDLDFVKREYKMELWLNFYSDKPCNLNNLENQIAIKEAKEMKVDIIPGWWQNTCLQDSSRISSFKEDSIKTGVRSKLLKINCILIENWDLDGYPFDQQILNITIYNSARRNKYYQLIPYDSKINYFDSPKKKVIIENGWAFYRDSASIQKTLIFDPFNGNAMSSSNSVDTLKAYSAIQCTIPVTREHQWGLFFKLLIGMYVAFFVAFVALFINIKETHTRFDLPVGGLFAAIANKYIIESSLPQTPDFSLIDWLHSVTIISILVIIAYSARLLVKIKANPDIYKEGYIMNNRRNIWIFSMVYFLINAGFIMWGVFHD